MTKYEVREQSKIRPEDSMLLRVTQTWDEAMEIAKDYNKQNVAAFVRVVEA